MNDIENDGKKGERIIREYFKSIGIKDIFQADWIIHMDGNYRLIEAKHQEIFIPPPFYGHGLPLWQIESRLRFFGRTRIEPHLFIVEKSDYEKRDGYHLIWHQSLIKLEMGNYKDTHGDKPRRIYDISNFNKIYFKK